MTTNRTSVRLPRGFPARVHRLAEADRRSDHAELLWLLERALLAEESRRGPDQMTLHVGDDRITSPDTAHSAIRLSQTHWAVTWLTRDRHITRNQAITAMLLAATIGVTERLQPVGLEVRVERRDPLWLNVCAWASELGLDGTGAAIATSNPPLWEA